MRITRRDKTQVAAEILRTCREESTMTRIIRIANVNYNTFYKHINPLVREGFLLQSPAEGKRNPGAKTKWTWTTTQKGTTLMRQLEKINKLLQPVGLRAYAE